MPAISGGDAAIIRYQYTRLRDVYLNIVKLDVDPDATATVDATPGSFPVATISVTGAGANFDNRQEVLVKITKPDGSTSYFGMNRTGTTTTTVPIIPVNDGDTIIPQEIARSIASGDTVQLYTARIPQAFYSRLDTGTGEAFKLYNVSYTDQNEDPAPFSAIAEGNQHYRVNVGEKATFDLTADWISWTGNSVTLTWVLPAGMTITAGTVNSASITVEADPGAYVVRLFVEDDVTGYEDVARRQIWVTDGSTSLAFSDQYAVSIESDRQDTIGRVMTFRVEVDAGTDMSAWFYPGAQCLFTYRHEFSDDAWQTVATPTAGTLVENFYGYLREFEQVRYDLDGVDTYVIRVEGAMPYFKSLQMPTQTLLANATPTAWEHVVPALANLEYFLFYLLRWHTRGVENLNNFSAVDLVDFESPALSARNTNIADSMAQVAKLSLSGRIGSRSRGDILARRHPSLESSAYRATVANQWTWTDADIVGGFEYSRNLVYRVAELEGAFIVSSTATGASATVARAGLFAPSQGLTRDTIDDFICLSSTTNGQDRVGDMYQYVNRPTETIRFEVPQGHDFTDPALLEYQTMDIAAYDPLDCGVYDNKVIPVLVERQWERTDDGQLTKRVFVTCEPETQGKRAPLKPQEALGDYMVVTPPLDTDFSVTMGGFVPTLDPPLSAVYTGGSGWTQTDFVTGGRWYTGASITRYFDTTTITQVVMVRSLNKNSYVPVSAEAVGIVLLNGGTVIGQYFVGGTAAGSGLQTETWTPLNPVVADQIILRVFSHNSGFGGAGGSVVIRAVTITTL